MACKRSAVRSRLAPPDFMSATDRFFRPASPSSRGLGHIPFTDATGVRIPVGTPLLNADNVSSWRNRQQAESTPKILCRNREIDSLRALERIGSDGHEIAVGIE